MCGYYSSAGINGALTVLLLKIILICKCLARNLVFNICSWKFIFFPFPDHCAKHINESTKEDFSAGIKSLASSFSGHFGRIKMAILSSLHGNFMPSQTGNFLGSFGKLNLHKSLLTAIKEVLKAEGANTNRFYQNEWAIEYVTNLAACVAYYFKQ